MFLCTFRGVVAESEDIIKTAAGSLGKNRFINYYGLQVQFCEHFLMLENIFPYYFRTLLSYVFYVLSVLEVVQYQHTLLGLLCLKESGRVL
jgi:hypothetical protein